MKKNIHTKLDNAFANKVISTVKNSKNIIITSHLGPDEDSIMSTLAMYYFLINHLKIDIGKVRMTYSWQKSGIWEYFVNYNKIEFVDDLYKHLDNTDLLIILDCSGWRRISRNPSITGFKGRTICIDHHPKPANTFDLHLIEKNYSSTCEILYRLFFEDKKLEKDICEILLAGILSDTGNFIYLLPDHTQTFDIAKRLITDGNINMQTLYSKYSGISFNVYKLITKLMVNGRFMQIEGWPKFFVSMISEEYVKRNNFNNAEISRASGIYIDNILKHIEDISWGLVVTPRGERFFNISSRSLPNSVSIRTIMEKLKIGGGHDRAAGGGVKAESSKLALDYVLKWMRTNKPLIK